MLKSWSYSRLNDFEQCPYRAKLKYIDRIPEPERQLPPGKTEHANDRGSRIHSECELYIKGELPTPPKEALIYAAELLSLRTKFKEGIVELEGEWGFTHNWEFCDYATAWLRLKCDVVVHLTSTHILVIDFKTGRKFGNEIKHGEQLQLYALCAALKYPTAEIIDVELWYFDQKDGENYTHDSKPAKKWLYHLKPFNNRGIKLTNATEFPANPNAISCKWCTYKENICKFAHQGVAPPPRRKGQK